METHFPPPLSERELTRRRREIERAVQNGQLTRTAADSLLEALKRPHTIRE